MKCVTYRCAWQRFRSCLRRPKGFLIHQRVKDCMMGRKENKASRVRQVRVHLEERRDCYITQERRHELIKRMEGGERERGGGEREREQRLIVHGLYNMCVIY